MKGIWRLLAVGLACLSALSACSGPRATRVDYAGGWSVECPAGLQHSWSDSQGPHAELDISSPSESIQISVYGLNLPYAEVVDTVNSGAVMPSMRDSLVTKREGIAVFQFQIPDYATGTLHQHVYVIRDLDSLRTGAVEGKTTDTRTEATDQLTRYCTQIAKSMTATSEWQSDGQGGPGP